MLRIRSTGGKLQEIDESYRFVELCDLDGKVAKVLYRDDMGVIHEVTAGSPEAARYKAAFKVEFIPLTRQ